MVPSFSLINNQACLRVCTAEIGFSTTKDKLICKESDVGTYIFYYIDNVEKKKKLSANRSLWYPCMCKVPVRPGTGKNYSLSSVSKITANPR